MRTALALCLLSLFTASAAERLSATCIGRIAYDLGRRGYDLRVIRVKGSEPGMLKLLVAARDRSGRLETLSVSASPESEGLEGCRVYSARPM